MYIYSMTIGPDIKPKVREFGNVKSPGRRGLSTNTSTGRIAKTSQQITAERAPHVDINTTDKETKVVLEIPGVNKEDIMISAHNKAVEVTASNPQKKYHKTIELP